MPARKAASKKEEKEEQPTRKNPARAKPKKAVVSTAPTKAPIKKKVPAKKKAVTTKKAPAKKKTTTKKVAKGKGNVPPKKKTTVKVPRASKATAPTKKKPKGRQTYRTMVLAAVRDNPNKRKGMSNQAINKYIIATYNIEKPNQAFLKLTLKRCIQDGTLKRKAASYVVGKAPPKKKTIKKKTPTKKTTTTKAKPTTKKKATTKKATPQKTATKKKTVSKKASSSSSSSSAPKPARPVAGIPEEENELHDVFQEFFEDMEEEAEETPLPDWHSDEAKAARLERRKHLWDAEKALEGQRSRYVGEIHNWADVPHLGNDDRRKKTDLPSFLAANPELDSKISVYRGVIYSLNVDGVCNATDRNLSGGGGLDAAIHSAANGAKLRQEINLLNGCPVGSSEITRGYHLPAKYILHCVGPTDSDARKLAGCYRSALDLAVEHGLRSVAFPCIATGSFGFPIEASSQVALQTVRRWLETGDNKDKIDRVVFVMFRQAEETAYFNYIPTVFPEAAAAPAPELVRQLEEKGEEAVAPVRQVLQDNRQLMNQWLPPPRRTGSIDQTAQID